MLNASPTSTPQQTSVRQRPLSLARSAGPQARTISRISSGSTPLSRETATNEGNTASARAPAKAAAVPRRRCISEVEQRHGEHARDRLGQQQAERREAEQLGARRLHPQGQRRLVHRDQPARVERHEHEVVQRAQHRLHARRVEDVRVAVLGRACWCSAPPRSPRGRSTARWRSLRGAPSRRRPRSVSVSPAARSAVGGGAVAGGVAVCGTKSIWRLVLGFEGARSAFARAMDLPRLSARERLQQPIEVVLVVPRPDRRSQPGPPGNVTHDDPHLRQLRALGRRVRAREGDERRLAARGRLASALGEQLGEPRGQRRARARARPASRPTRARRWPQARRRPPRR